MNASFSSPGPLDPLPIDTVIPELLSALDQCGQVVLKAPTGAGKTTRVPPAVLDHRPAAAGAVIVLQPRRLAARTSAARIAAERNGRLGEEVGYRIRFDQRANPGTRLIVVTEGILLRMLQENPYLEGIGTIVFDEFHERNLNSDLALAMVRRVRQSVRPDLWLVVMSATLDPQPLSQFLSECPTVESHGRTFPVEVEYLKRPDRRPLPELVAAGVERIWSRTDGDVLVFLPGQKEMRQSAQELERFVHGQNVELMFLYGDLPAELQDAVMERRERRKLILSTNVAETSLTIPGITAVVDSGLARCLRFDPSSGLDRLEVEGISKASADQRAGRAGRERPGFCLRLWDEKSHRHRPEQQTPEIQRVDLAGPVLQLRAWGESDLDEFPWFEAPTAAQLHQADELLRRLHAVEDGIVSTTGQALARIPAHPRIGRLLLAGHALQIPGLASLAAALLSERDPFQRRSSGGPQSRQNRAMQTATTRSESDIVDRVQALREFEQSGRFQFPQGELNRGASRFLLKARDQFVSILDEVLGYTEELDDNADQRLMRALLTAYPDRLARRRAPGDARAIMANGKGVKLAPSSAVTETELFVCIDVDAGQRDALVRLASAVDIDWLDPGEFETADDLFFHPTQRKVVARRRLSWGGLVLEEANLPVKDSAQTVQILSEAARQNWSHAFPEADQDVQRLLTRIQWLTRLLPEHDWPELGREGLVKLAAQFLPAASSLDEWKRADWKAIILGSLTWEQQQLLEQEAPERIEVPSGSRIVLEYRGDQPPILAVRIQELFGLAETPRVGAGRARVLLHLLAPNQRPQQITDDLASFWENTYPQVRKDLRARYPKHAWPEHPLQAVPERAPGKGRKR